MNNIIADYNSKNNKNHIYYYIIFHFENYVYYILSGAKILNYSKVQHFNL